MGAVAVASLGAAADLGKAASRGLSNGRRAAVVLSAPNNRSITFVVVEQPLDRLCSGPDAMRLLGGAPRPSLPLVIATRAQLPNLGANWLAVVSVHEWTGTAQYHR